MAAVRAALLVQTLASKVMILYLAQLLVRAVVVAQAMILILAVLAVLAGVVMVIQMELIRVAQEIPHLQARPKETTEVLAHPTM